MKQSRLPKRFWSGALLFGLAISTASAAAEEPAGLFLTWQQDPTTTMTIDWHTVPNGGNAEQETIIKYREVGAEKWESRKGSRHTFPHSDRTIHRVELAGLEPGALYRFRVGEFEKRYKFRTMPTDIAGEPLVFAIGGDVRHQRSWMERTNKVAMRYDPDFIVWGGDLAYADGRADRVYRWHEWFEVIRDTLVTEEGRVVPIVVGIGNHEMNVQRGGGFWYSFDDYEQTDQWREANVPYFFPLFAFPGQPGYNVLDFGEYLSLISLDSGHANPVEGEQTEWLEELLAERREVPHVFPFYHVAAFPSARGYGGRVATRIRDNWAPLFDKYGVRVAFENHDHTYKRTPPLRMGEGIHPAGVVYLGDGAWGVSTREVHDPAERSYLERAESIRHAIIGTLHGTHQHFLVVSEEGEVIDEYPSTRRHEATDFP